MQEYLKKYYCPANAVAVLISKHEPDDFFRLLDEESETVEKGQRHTLETDFAPKPISKQIEKYACDASSNTVYMFRGMYVDVTQSIDIKESLLFDIIHYILHDAPGAYVSKIIEESGLCDSFASETSDDTGALWIISQLQCQQENSA